MSVFGTAGLTKMPGDKYKVAQNGFATYDVSYKGIVVGTIPFLQGDVSEDYPNTVLMELEIIGSGDQCNDLIVNLHYEGKDETSTVTGVSDNIQVDFTTSQDPIESNPDFCSSIGGTPSAPLHGAYFDATTGQFLGFPVEDPDEPGVLPSRFAGIRSYLVPQETAVSDSIQFDYPSAEEIATVGRVVTPSIFLPTLPGNRNWLNTGIRIRNIGNVYFQRQDTFQSSGPRGWVPEIYGTAP